MFKGLILCCCLALAAPACAKRHTYTVLSRAELDERGTHRYSDVSREKATQACATALATLGYEVTVTRTDDGVVKTAPAVVMTSATGGNGRADVIKDSLAWTLVVETSGADVVVRASPRWFRNGSEVLEEGVSVAEVMDPKFRDLWRELDEALHVQPSSSPPRA